MFWLFFGHSTFSKLSIIWFISPVPTCLVHNCKAVWIFRLSDLAFTFVSWLNLLISISTLVSSHEVVEYLGVMEVVKTRVLERKLKGIGVDKKRLGPEDVNLQTEELQYNYLVLIVSPK